MAILSASLSPPALPTGLPVAGRGQGHSQYRQGMQSGPMTCLARQVPCSQPGLLENCQRAEWSVESKGPPLGWANDSVCGRASWELGPWAGSCRNSGSTRSSLRRRPLWSWAPLHCTRFSSSTRPGGGHKVKGPIHIDLLMLLPQPLCPSTSAASATPLPDPSPVSPPTLKPSSPPFPAQWHPVH